MHKIPNSKVMPQQYNKKMFCAVSNERLRIGESPREEVYMTPGFYQAIINLVSQQ
jgi:hypothetical protein